MNPAIITFTWWFLAKPGMGPVKAYGPYPSQQFCAAAIKEMITNPEIEESRTGGRICFGADDCLSLVVNCQKLKEER